MRDDSPTRSKSGRKSTPASSPRSRSRRMMSGRRRARSRAAVRLTACPTTDRPGSFSISNRRPERKSSWSSTKRIRMGAAFFSLIIFEKRKNPKAIDSKSKIMSEKNAAPIRILLVDDHELFLSGLRLLIDQARFQSVIGEDRKRVVWGKRVDLGGGLIIYK